LFALGAVLSDDATIGAITGGDSLLENSHTRWKYSPGYVNSNPRLNVSLKYSAKKFFNVTNVKDNLTRLGATFGSNPTDQAFYNVFISSPGGGLTSPAYNVVVMIDYIVALSEPKELAQS